MVTLGGNRAWAVRRRLALVLTVAVVAIGLFAVAGERPVGAEHGGSADRVDVMTWNLKRGLNSPGGSLTGIEVVDLFKARVVAFEVDVASFQEITREQADELARRLGWERAHYAQTSDPCLPGIDFPLNCQPFGNALLSKYPAENRLVRPFAVVPGDGQNRNALRFVISLPGGTSVHFYGTHFASVGERSEPEGDVERTGQASKLIADISGDSGQASPFRPVLAGDFNSDPGDPATGVLRTRFDDAGPPLLPTVGAKRLDYVYVGKGSGIAVKNAQIDPFGRLFSDHTSVIAELAVPTETCRPRASQAGVATLGQTMVIPAAIGVAAPFRQPSDCGR